MSRRLPRTSFDVTFELVTPAYTGGADPYFCDPLRPPALKSLIRFWWRTMHGSLNQHDLLAKEETVFGSSKQDVGRRFDLRPTRELPALTYDARDKKETGAVHSYMAYGPVLRDKAHGANYLEVPRMHAGSRASFQLLCVQHVEAEVVKALWLLSTLGGYGGRSRRGWGGLSVTADWRKHGLPNFDDASGDVGAAVKTGLRACLPSTVASKPAYPAFSNDALLRLGDAKPTWEAALNEEFTKFHAYRRMLGAVQGHTARSIPVGPDHALRSGWLTGAPAAGTPAPAAAAFGLPLNAKFTSGAKVNVGVGDKATGRRASPLFFKVLRARLDGKVQFFPLALWLPSSPPADVWAYIEQGALRGEHGPLADPGDGAIHSFLDGTAFRHPTGSTVSHPGLGWTKVWP